MCFCTHFESVFALVLMSFQELQWVFLGLDLRQHVRLICGSDLHGALYKNDVFFAFSACE